MESTIKAFQDESDLKKEIKRWRIQERISTKHIYIMSHDDGRTERIANSIPVGKLGKGLSAPDGHVFAKKGDKLRTDLEHLGLSQEESNDYEEKLDHGTILLIHDLNSA